MRPCPKLARPGIFLFFVCWLLVSFLLPMSWAVTDATNFDINIGNSHKRIVSLNPDSTEIIYALGRQDDLLAVTRFCPFQDGNTKKESIGSLLDPDIERIIELKPDMVFAALVGSKRQSVEKLRNAGIKVFVLERVRTFDDLYRRIEVMGSILGREGSASDLINSMKAKLDLINRAIQSRGIKPRVFIQIGADPVFSANKRTIINDVLERAGGDNIASEAKTEYPVFSVEKVVMEKPDYIIIASMGGFGEKAKAEWEKYTSINAVKSKRVYVVNADFVCNIGPRLVDGVEMIAGILYPDIFKGNNDKN